MNKRIYRISVSESAPRLVISPDQQYAQLFEEISGQSLMSASPEKSLNGYVSEVRNWNQFYRTSPGALAISESAWENCMEMYYVVTGNDIELISVVTDQVDLRLINPMQVLPGSFDSLIPCDISFANQLFRMASCPSELFCISGGAVPGNEFKFIYDYFGFEGLVFEEVWVGG